MLSKRFPTTVSHYHFRNFYSSRTNVFCTPYRGNFVLPDAFWSYFFQPPILFKIAHELGHDQQHRNIAKAGKPLKEFSLFSMKDTTEYEANAFASHILLDNDEVYSLAKEGYDVVDIAKSQNTDINLMLIKMQEMNKLGYDFNIPYNPDSRFFRKIHK